MQHRPSFLCLIVSALVAFGACGSDSDTDLSSSTDDASAAVDVSVEGDVIAVEDDTTSTSEDDSTASTDDAVEDAVPCTPTCDGKNCGPDGCGGSCGDCVGTDECKDGVCSACEPACGDNTCGDDGCGGSCGECPEGETCNGAQCEVPPGAICLDMVGCLKDACDGSSSPTCGADNIDACGPADTQEQADATVALIQCLIDAGCSLDASAETAACQRANCLSETATCATQTNGDAQCHTLIPCIKACPGDFVTGEPANSCIADCMATASAEEVEEYYEFTLCADAQCIGSTEYESYEMCFKDETENKPTCSTVYSDCTASLTN